MYFSQIVKRHRVANCYITLLYVHCKHIYTVENQIQFDEMTSTEKTVFILYLFLSILAMTAALVTMVYLFIYVFVGGGH